MNRILNILRITPFVNAIPALAPTLGRVLIMSILYEANTFHRTRVEVHPGAAYRANTLDDCLVVVTGIPDQWSDNLVSNCRFQFAGGRLMAEQFAASVAATDPSLSAAIRAHLRRDTRRLN